MTDAEVLAFAQKATGPIPQEVAARLMVLFFCAFHDVWEHGGAYDAATRAEYKTLVTLADAWLLPTGERLTDFLPVETWGRDA